MDLIIIFQIFTIFYFISTLITTFLIQILIFDIFFKLILGKINCCTLTPSYLGSVSFATVIMAVNSPQPTLLCVITLCVCLSIIYNQDVPFLDFFVSFVVAVVVAVIVVRNQLLGLDWLVVIPLGTIICLPERGAAMVGVSFVQISPLILRHPHHSHSRGESPIWTIIYNQDVPD